MKPMTRSQRYNGYVRAIRSTPNFERYDANETAALARELLEVDARIFEQGYLPNGGMDILPINGSIPAGKTEYSYPIVYKVGSAKRVVNYATDFPAVDVYADEVTSAIATYGDSYNWTIQDLESQAFMRVKPEQWKPRVARQAIDEFVDRVLLTGDSSAGIEGFFNNSIVDDNLVSVTNGSWDTEADAMKILADLNYLAGTSRRLTSGVEVSDSLVLPEAAAIKLTTTPISSTQPLMTIMSVFRANNPQIKNVYFNARLNTGDAGGTKWRAIAYTKDPAKLEGIVPIAFDQDAPIPMGFYWSVKCRAKCGGTAVRYPVSVQYSDNVHS